MVVHVVFKGFGYNVTVLSSFVSQGGELLKKLMIVVALLAMMLTASAPLVLAQQTPSPEPPSPTPPSSPAPPPLVPDDSGGSVGPAVGCQELYDDPTAFCIIDENGLITLPDGSLAPVFVQFDGAVYIEDANGEIVLIGEGASFIMEDEESVGDGQYDNAEEGPPAPVSPETSG